MLINSELPILLQCMQKLYILKITMIFSPKVTKRTSKPQAALLWADVKHINSPAGLPDPISGCPVKRIADGLCPRAIFLTTGLLLWPPTQLGWKVMLPA